MSVRTPTHAGSWFENNPRKLTQEVTEYMDRAGEQPQPVKALIAPHAGICYSGPCAGHTYRALKDYIAKNPGKISRAFLLGPSHHVPLDGCLLTQFETWASPN
eukprot:gene11076-3329_t